MAQEEHAPLVSVVIPCYNAGKYLARTIESVLSQSYPNRELLVVNDGSSDDTGEVAARYAAVRYFVQPNNGVAEARNFGFAQSKGEFVQFLDADDRLTQQSIEAHLRCFTAHPEAGFVVGEIEWIDAADRYLGKGRSPLLDLNHYEELLKVNHVANTIAVLFRRSVFETVGGFNGFFSPAEDYEMLLRAARAFPSAHHATVVAQYRRHSTNASRKGAIMLKAMHRVIVAEREFVKESPRLETALRKGDQHWREFFGGVAIKEIYSELCQFRVGNAAVITGALLWYVRGRIFVIPWKYRSRAVQAIRQRLHKLQNRVLASVPHFARGMSSPPSSSSPSANARK